MQNSKKLFNRLNSDDAERFLEETDYINLENALIAQNEYSKNFAVQNIPSTELLFYYTSGLNTLGTAVDYQFKRVFWLDHNESDGRDTLFCYDLEDKTTYRVIVSNEITGGLNLSKDFRIDRNLKIINGEAIWTDNLNEPKSINVEAGIKTNQPAYVTDVQPYAVPIPYTTSTLIKRPPIYQLDVSKVYDAGFPNNYTVNHSFQFYYRYQYKNFQYSANSVISDLIYDNFEDDDFNSVAIEIPFTEHIDDYILAVEIVVRYGNTGKSFIVKSWNKDNTDDAAEIVSHNAGSAELSYTFYNNTLGIALSDIEANTYFHPVPLLAKTLEAAKNRAFLGNVLKGYDTPTTSSLEAELNAKTTTDICLKSGSSYRLSVTFFDRFKRPCGRVVTDVVLTTPYRESLDTTFIPSLDWTLSNTNALVEIPDWAYYYQIDWSKNQSETFYVQTVARAISYVKKNDDGTLENAGFVYDNQDTYALAVDISNLYVYGQGYTFTEGDYGVLFVNGVPPYILRVLGQQGNNVLLSPIDLTGGTSKYYYEAPQVSYFNDANNYFFYLDFISSVNPSAGIGTSSVTVLSGANSITNSDTQDIMNFVITLADRKFQLDIDLNFSAGTVGKSYNFSVNVTLTHPTLSNINYTIYQKNGAAGGTTYEDSAFKQLEIPAGYEKLFLWISANIGDIYINTFSATFSEVPVTTTQLELYTPYTPSETEPYYGVGEIMDVTNPTLNSRQYSVLSGTIQGDSFVLQRTINIDENTPYTFYVEAMSPNDNTWQLWQRNLGWPSFVDTIGQQRKDTFIDYSDTFINGAKVNGLNSFQPLNEKDIGASSGQIQKLQLTNKMEESGTVMLVITDTDTLSAYLSETQLYNAATVNALITTDQVIGTINALQNGQGTINPESVVEYNGTVWWINVLKGVVAQYAANGVVSVSDFKMRRFFDRFSKRYVYLGKDAVEELCGFSHIAGCVDISNNLYMLVLPQTEENAVVSGLPVGFAPALPSYDSLPDYASSIQNRFDIYDGQPKIMNYDYVQNKWVGAFQWLPETMEYFGNKLFGFKDGFLYLHNENISSYNTIYGVQYPQRVCFTCNLPASEVKSILNIALESQQIPNFTVLYTNYPNEQISDLTEDDYINQEGVQYADVFRDRLSPNTAGTVIDKLYNGDVIVGAVCYVMIEFQEYTEQLILNLTNIGFQLSRGQSNILKNIGK